MVTPTRRLVVMTAAITTLIAGSSIPAAADPTPPAISLISANDVVEVERWGKGSIWLDLGIYLQAQDAPLELAVRRTAYDEPITVTQVMSDGSTVDRPGARVWQFQKGLGRFLEVTIKQDGVTLLQRIGAYCPNNWEQARLHPDAPDTSPYPYDCGWSPLVLGSTWGIEQGWGTGVTLGSADLKEGNYNVFVTVTNRYASMFGIDEADRTVKVRAKVRNASFDGGVGPKPIPLSPNRRLSPDEPGPAVVPGDEARPDLVSGPAWALSTRSGRISDYLEFAATVWNAGPANLVVDGFRNKGEDVMRAYQSFYENGTKVGTVETGNLIYDPRPGHEHWHFQDFAIYRLLDMDENVVVTSGKEAFCLAPTDAIDLAAPGAVWRPENVGFGSACGWKGSLSLREVLQSGWGDTYYQSVPGQSFNITNVPNGSYLVEVVANAEGRLYEVTDTNNRSLRQIELGGVPGERTVVASPYQGLEI